MGCGKGCLAGCTRTCDVKKTQGTIRGQGIHVKQQVSVLPAETASAAHARPAEVPVLCGQLVLMFSATGVLPFVLRSCFKDLPSATTVHTEKFS